MAPSADPDFESDTDWVAQDLEAEFAALDDQPIRELQLSLPASESVPYAMSEQLLLALKSCQSPVAFEVIGDETAIALQLACRKPDYAHVANQVRAHLPEAVISESNSFLEARWKRAGRASSAILELCLSRNYLFPMRTYAALDADLLLGIVGTLDGLQTGEVGLLQVLFQPARRAWADRIWSTIAEWERHGGHPDASSRVLKARAKIARPLYAAVVRVAARSLQERRAHRVVRALGSAFAPLALPVGNELVPLPDHYDLPREHVVDVLKRRSRRSGMILNSEGLATLVPCPRRQCARPSSAATSGARRPPRRRCWGIASCLARTRMVARRSP